MAHDLVIRGGFIVDGTGSPGRPGDVAVSDGRIAEVGTVTGRGDREVDAGGLVVAPGFIDPHTLAPGLAADITVFDPAAIVCHEEEIVHDLPDGGPRYVSRASGIRWSFVGGQPIIRDGRLPEPGEVSAAGRVIRAA